MFLPNPIAERQIRICATFEMTLGYQGLASTVFPSLRIRVSLRSPDKTLLFQSHKAFGSFLPQTVPQALKHSTTPPYPVSRTIITVLRSPHVNKTSREQFQRKEYQGTSQISVNEHFSRFAEHGIYRLHFLIDKWIPAGVRGTMKITPMYHKYARLTDYTIQTKKTFTRRK
jgi:ribosomal protein S10